MVLALLRVIELKKKKKKFTLRRRNEPPINALLSLIRMEPARVLKRFHLWFSFGILLFVSRLRLRLRLLLDATPTTPPSLRNYLGSVEQQRVFPFLLAGLLQEELLDCLEVLGHGEERTVKPRKAFLWQEEGGGGGTCAEKKIRLKKQQAGSTTTTLGPAEINLNDTRYDTQ